MDDYPPTTAAQQASAGARSRGRHWRAVPVLPAGMATAATLLAILYTAHFARALLIPIVFSILIALLLAGPVRWLCALRVPRAFASALMVVLTLVVSGGVVAALAGPAQTWMERAPQAAQRLEKQLREWRKPLKAATDVTERVMSFAEGDDASRKPPVVVSVDAPSGLLRAAPAILASLVASVFLTFLLLMHGDSLMRKSVMLIPRFRTKIELVKATREVQGEFSRYLLTISAINAGLGAATALALTFLNVPDPLLWGGMTALLNFAPYVGPTLGALMLVLVGYAEPASGVHAIAPAAAFLSLHALESQVVTPLLVGRQLALDPVVIFLSLMLFGWLWGIPGMLMAVPILTCLKVVAGHGWLDARWLGMLTHNASGPAT